MDDQMSAETESIVRSGREARAEEWRELEPPGEDQPVPDVRPAPDDLELRAELASYLGKNIWPASREKLIQVANSHHAPDRVIDLLRRLPERDDYVNLAAVWDMARR